MNKCLECGRPLPDDTLQIYCEPCIRKEEEEDEAQAMKVIVHCADCGVKDSEPVMLTCDDCKIYLCSNCWHAHDCDDWRNKK